MRIISGNLKGRKLFLPSSKITRPLRDLVKENIFNIINHSNLIDVKIKGSSILDLYSGIGSFGIECISRGAKHVTFVEKNKETFNILKKNLVKFSIEKKAALLTEDVNKAINGISELSKFNIFFFRSPIR
mgnify:CR=1 FL=1